MRRKILWMMCLLCLLLAACGNNVTSEDTSSVSEEIEYDPTIHTSYENPNQSVDPAVDVSADVEEADPKEVTDPDASEDDLPNNEDAKEPAKVELIKPVKNSFSGLSVPTYVAKYDGLYFIVDCYNNQVIYNDNMEDPLTEWKVMAGDLNRPHTIASDGNVYLVDDTDNNRIIALRKTDPSLVENGETVFEITQEFTDMGERPHFITYREEEDTFYAWSSMSGEMWLLKKEVNGDRVFVSDRYVIPSLKDVYVRSFYIEEQTTPEGEKHTVVYFVSGVYGNCSIFEVDFSTFEVIREIPVAPEIGGMVQIQKIQDYYYVSVSTSLYGETNLMDFLRTDSLEHLMVGQYESLYGKITDFGTPYNFNCVDDVWYLAIHKTGGVNDIMSFKVENNEFVVLEGYY